MPLRDSLGSSPVSQFPTAGGVAPSPTNASVNSLTPANGIVGASDLLRLVDEASDEKLVDGARSRVDGKIVVIVGDLEHQLPGPLGVHLLSQDADFFRSLVPMLGVVEVPGIWHGTRAFLGAA